jgi:cytoskeleton protein RodZ
MKTQSIGELLRQEREAHRLPLPELAKRTRIRLEYLEALEHNQFDRLPAATFVKGNHMPNFSALTTGRC